MKGPDARLKVLIVEDSLTVRKYMAEILGSNPAFRIVGEALDGDEAIRMTRELDPDVITMDLQLKTMSGLEATEEIMAFHPTPILVVSSAANRGDAFDTFDALAAGAVDVLEKPVADRPDGAWEKELVEKVQRISRIRVITHPRARMRSRSHPPVSPPGPRSTPRPRGEPPRRISGERRFPTALGIGASTGGPAALRRLFVELSPDLSVPVLLVIHLPATFVHQFARWLETEVSVSVKVAEDGQDLSRARGVIVPPPDRHLTISRGRIVLTDGPERNFCRPSVDVLFESMAKDLGPSALACLLTGMGRDGAEGLLAIRNAGGYTVAQDARSAVVFGMPGEAIKRGAALKTLPIESMGEHLDRLVTEGWDPACPP